MASTKENIASANEKTLEVISGIQERIVSAHQELAETLSGLVPDSPSWLPTAEPPEGTDPRELIKESFAFQARLMEANKAFSLGLIEAWSQADSKAGSKSTKARGSAKQ